MPFCFDFFVCRIIATRASVVRFPTNFRTSRSLGVVVNYIVVKRFAIRFPAYGANRLFRASRGSASMPESCYRSRFECGVANGTFFVFGTRVRTGRFFVRYPATRGVSEGGNRGGFGIIATRASFFALSVFRAIRFGYGFGRNIVPEGVDFRIRRIVATRTSLVLFPTGFGTSRSLSIKMFEVVPEFFGSSKLNIVTFLVRTNA